jgi:hypothetical protein
MEGSFADAANNHGFKRARWRGLERVRVQNLLIAAIQNVRKLLRAWRRGAAAAAGQVRAAISGVVSVFRFHVMASFCFANRFPPAVTPRPAGTLLPVAAPLNWATRPRTRGYYQTPLRG